MKQKHIQIPLFVHAVALLFLFTAFSKEPELNAFSTILYCGLLLAVASIAITQITSQISWVIKLKDKVDELSFPLCAMITGSTVIFVNKLPLQMVVPATAIIASLTIVSLFAHAFIAYAVQEGVIQPQEQ